MADFERLWQGLDIDRLDADMRSAIEHEQDYCPWGVGVNMGRETGLAVHVYREDPEVDEFTVLEVRKGRRWILGVLPWGREEREIRTVAGNSGVLEYMRGYFSAVRRD